MFPPRYKADTQGLGAGRVAGEGAEGPVPQAEMAPELTAFFFQVHSHAFWSPLTISVPAPATRIPSASRVPIHSAYNAYAEEHLGSVSGRMTGGEAGDWLRTMGMLAPGPIRKPPGLEPGLLGIHPDFRGPVLPVAFPS